LLAVLIWSTALATELARVIGRKQLITMFFGPLPTNKA
jgi:hypothetical protein